MVKIQNQSTKNDPIITALPIACALESKAVEFMELQRWDGRAACPRCGSEAVNQIKDSKTGERANHYRWSCNACRKAGDKWQFSVRTGTVFEDSKIELRHWNFAFWRAATSKKGVSALEIKRQTGLSYKSSLFMLTRIRFAMGQEDGAALGPDGGDVEVDETYIGGKPRHFNNSRKTVKVKKAKLLAAVERGGKVRVKPVARVTSASVAVFIRDNVSPSARLLTDDSMVYDNVGRDFERGHEVVNHSKWEYARGDAHSNTVEGFFSILKRGLNGIHHAVSAEHLNRYVSHYQFLYNNRELSDGQRTRAAIKAADGKRITYKDAVAK